MTLQLSPDGGLPPERPLVLSDVVTPLGDAIVAQARLSAMDWSISLMGDARRIDEAQNGKAMFSGRGPARRAAATSPKLTLAQAEKIVNDRGLSDAVKPFDGIRVETLNVMIERTLRKKQYEDTLSRADEGFSTQLVLGATGLAVDFADPVNLATMAVPGVGEAKAAYLLTKATAKLGPTASKLLVRAGVGAYDGAVSTAMLEPLNYASHRKVGDDYTLTDSLKNVGLGAIGGATLHALGGTGLDLYRGMTARQGRTVEEFGDVLDLSLHQIGQGEPLDQALLAAGESPAVTNFIDGASRGPNDELLAAREKLRESSFRPPTYSDLGLVDVIRTTIDTTLDRLDASPDLLLVKFRVDWGGGERVKNVVGRNVHEAVSHWVKEMIPSWSSNKAASATSKFRPDFNIGEDSAGRKMLIELKPASGPGRRKGGKQTADYEEVLQSKAEVIYYEYSSTQMDKLKRLTERIKDIQARHPELAPEYVKPPRRKRKPNPPPAQKSDEAPNDGVNRP